MSAGWVFPGPDVFFAESEVAGVAEGGQNPAVDCLANSTGILVRVRAVLEAAPGEKRAEFGEVAVHVIACEVPEFELADARGVTDPATE